MDEKVEYLKEAFDRHEHAWKTFRQSQTQSIKDLSNQVYALSSKIDQSIVHLGQDSTVNGSSKAPTLPQIEFPKFNGEDFGVWKYKCNQFFQLFENIPDDSKVKLASIHLEGKALSWHQNFIKKRCSSDVVGWDEYIKAMEAQFDMRMRKQERATPSLEIKRPHRRICKLQEFDDDDEETKKLDKCHFRFGPIYQIEEDCSAKKEAWQHVLNNSPDRAGETTEIYLSAIRQIEKQARDCYADGEADCFPGTQFRWMMIWDGCFFLQLALCMLGGSQQLGYPANHLIFGKNRNYSRFREVKEWIEAMFFVGNQIPLVVLEKLIKQKYFQNVITNGKWEHPSDISRRALYELLLSPELEANSPKTCRAVKGLWRKVFDPITYWMLQQEPNDLLHGLQLLVMGPDPREEEAAAEEEDPDLESQYNIDSSLGPADDSVQSSATDLKQAGIHFWVSHTIGSRGIDFSNSMFLCYGYAITHLPPVSIEEDTEIAFKCLRDYEISQKLSLSKREVCSYIQFMSELIRTPDDAKLIIRGDPKHKHKLPGILRRLASTTPETYNQNLRVVKLKISDYSPPIWKKYWHIISFGLILTVLQTVYNILRYYKSS